MAHSSMKQRSRELFVPTKKIVQNSTEHTKILPSFLVFFLFYPSFIRTIQQATVVALTTLKTVRIDRATFRQVKTNP